MSETEIKKKLVELISFFMKYDRIRGKKLNKFSFLYSYVNYYIENRFFFIAEKIYDMYKDKVFGARNRFKYLDSLDFKLVYPRHYDSSELLKNFKQYGKEESITTQDSVEYNRL